MSLGPAQRAAIVAAVGERPGLLDDLDEMLDNYAAAAAEENSGRVGRHRYKSAPPRDTKRTAQRIKRVALELRAAIDKAPEMVRERLRVLARRGDDRDVFAALVDSLQPVAAAASALAVFAGKTKATSGPKVDALRRSFDLAVGAILEQYDVRASIYSEGVFKRVLAACWNAATGNKLPVDVLPRLSRAVKAFRESPIPEGSGGSGRNSTSRTGRILAGYSPHGSTSRRPRRVSHGKDAQEAAQEGSSRSPARSRTRPR